VPLVKGWDLVAAMPVEAAQAGVGLRAPHRQPQSRAAIPSGSGVFAVDFEEGCLILIAIVALIGGAVACFYVIYIAPALLAEILVDGVLLAGLYRRVRNIEQRHWLLAAVRRTLAPAMLAAMFFAIAGWGLQKAVPEAHTIGQVWKHVTRIDE